MKLLFDNNLSVRLPQVVQELFPGSTHVFDFKLDKASDREIFRFAQEHNYTIVTKDKDYYHLLNLLGSPPKVVWFTLGNCCNEEVISAFTNHVDTITEFLRSNKSLLVIDKLF